MSTDFFDDPENRVILQICRSSPGFIPIVLGGKLHPVREGMIDHYPVSPNLSAEDFALGLEVLGCKLTRDSNDRVVVRQPLLFRTDVWRDRARRIQALMTDDCEGRETELSDYLHARTS